MTAAASEAARAMFTAQTRGIEITVVPSYLPAESDPDSGRYVWAYFVTVENRSPVTVRLLSRHWLITDANGTQREVSGPGVVGLQPTIPPGERFTYTSGCPLPTSSGFMSGSYQMVDERGEAFDAEVPAFSLDMPDMVRVIN